MKNFAECLKTAMAQAGMNQSTLSEKTGCSKAAISQYLSGKNTPSKFKIEQLANALDVQPDYLKGDDVPPMKGVPKNITPEIAAKCIEGVGRCFVTQGLKNGTLHIGTAVLMPSGKYRYNIVPFQLRNYVGAERFNEFFGIPA